MLSSKILDIHIKIDNVASKHLVIMNEISDRKIIIEESDVLKIKEKVG